MMSLSCPFLNARVVWGSGDGLRFGKIQSDLPLVEDDRTGGYLPLDGSGGEANAIKDRTAFSFIVNGAANDWLPKLGGNLQRQVLARCAGDSASVFFTW